MRVVWASWQQALLGGITYRLAIYRQGLRLSSRRHRMLAWLEFGLMALVIMGALMMSVFAASTVFGQVVLYHLVVMMLANASVGTIAVWGVHHDCDETIARTERNPLVNLLTFNLLYHVEHHLFPAIPSNNLPALAKRLDAAALHLTNAPVLPSRTTVIKHMKHRWNAIKDKYQNSDDSECPIRKRFA